MPKETSPGFWSKMRYLDEAELGYNQVEYPQEEALYSKGPVSTNVSTLHLPSDTIEHLGSSPCKDDSRLPRRMVNSNSTLEDN